MGTVHQFIYHQLVRAAKTSGFRICPNYRNGTMLCYCSEGGCEQRAIDLEGIYEWPGVPRDTHRTDG